MHTQEGKGVVVSETERHERLFVVRTRTYVCLRQLWVFITRENASLSRLIMPTGFYLEMLGGKERNKTKSNY